MFSDLRIMRLWWLGMAIILIFLALSPAASAQTLSTSDTWNLPSILGETTIRLEGYKPETTLSLVLPEGWQPSADGTLTLDYRLSDLVSEGATLTIRLNDQPIASTALQDNAGLLKFDLSTDYFLPGENSLALTTFLPLEEDQTCIVPDHPARWLEFGPNSQLSIELAPTGDLLSLANFPAQFESMGNDQAAPIFFVIPDVPTNDELSALSAVGFALAQGSKTTPQWQAVFASEFNSGNISGPAIWLGENGNAPYLNAMMPPNGAQAGWLSLIRPNIWKGYPILVVGGPDGEGLLRAARMLSDPLAVAQMSAESVIVENLPTSESDSLEEKFSLADLGYGERVLKGSGELSLIYSFDIPFAWSPEDGQLTLNFAHSANLNSEAATLTVLLNGHTAVGLRLDAPEIATNVVEVTLPKGFIRPGKNFLPLAFDFGPPVESCYYSSNQQAWASIRPETTLTLPHGKKGGRLDLNDFPFNLSSEADMAELSIVLPENITSGDLTQAMNLIRQLSSAGSRFAPSLVRADGFDTANRTRHLIIIGANEQQPLLSELKSYLPFSLENNQLSSYGIRLPNDSPDLGVIQVLRSPWADNRVILIVSGKTKVGYDQAIQLLTDPRLQTELNDQLVFVWRSSGIDDPQVYTQRIPDIPAVPGVGFLDRLLGRFFKPGSPWPTVILVSAVTFGIVVLAIAGYIIQSWRRRRQKVQSGD